MICYVFWIIDLLGIFCIVFFMGIMLFVIFLVYLFCNVIFLGVIFSDIVLLLFVVMESEFFFVVDGVFILYLVVFIDI